MPLEIAELIYNVRQQLGLLQEKSATRLGLSFCTVNRWVKRPAVPSSLALQQELLCQIPNLSELSVFDLGKYLPAQYCHN